MEFSNWLWHPEASETLQSLPPLMGYCYHGKIETTIDKMLLDDPFKTTLPHTPLQSMCNLGMKFSHFDKVGMRVHVLKLSTYATFYRRYQLMMLYVESLNHRTAYCLDRSCPPVCNSPTCFSLSYNLPNHLHPFSLFLQLILISQCFHLASTSPVSKGVCCPSTIRSPAKPFIGSLSAQLAKNCTATVHLGFLHHKLADNTTQVNWVSTNLCSYHPKLFLKPSPGAHNGIRVEGREGACKDHTKD